MANDIGLYRVTVRVGFSNYNDPNSWHGIPNITSARMIQTNHGEEDDPLEVWASSSTPNPYSGSVDFEFRFPKSDWLSGITYMLLVEVDGYENLELYSLDGSTIANYCSYYQEPYALPLQEMTYIVVGQVILAIFGDGIHAISGLHVNIGTGDYYNQDYLEVMMVPGYYTITIDSSNYVTKTKDIYVAPYGYQLLNITLTYLNSVDTAKETGRIALRFLSKETGQEYDAQSLILLDSDLGMKRLISENGMREAREITLTFAKNDWLVQHFRETDNETGDYLIDIYAGANLIMRGVADVASTEINQDTVRLSVNDYLVLIPIYGESLFLKVRETVLQEFRAYPSNLLLKAILDEIFDESGIDFSSPDLPNNCKEEFDFTAELPDWWSDEDIDGQGEYGQRFYMGFPCYNADHEDGEDVFAPLLDCVVLYRTIWYAEQGDGERVTHLRIIVKGPNGLISFDRENTSYPGAFLSGTREAWEKDIEIFSMDSDCGMMLGGHNIRGIMPSAVDTRQVDDHECQMIFGHKVYSARVTNWEKITPLRAGELSYQEILKSILWVKDLTVIADATGRIRFMNREMLANGFDPLVVGSDVLPDGWVLSDAPSWFDSDREEDHSGALSEDAEFFEEKIKQLKRRDAESTWRSRKGGELEVLSMIDLHLGDQIILDGRTLIVIGLKLDDFGGKYDVEYLE